MARLAARRAAMQMIYEQMFGGEGGDETLFGLVEYPKEEGDTEYIYELVNGTIRHAEELDQTIAAYSPKRELNRMPGILHAILRLALYELQYCPNTPESVVINEAVEMVKRFSQPDEGRFINGLLGAYNREHPRG